MTRHTFTTEETKEALHAHYKIPITDTIDFDEGEFIPWMFCAFVISIIVATIIHFN